MLENWVCTFENDKGTFRHEAGGNFKIDNGNQSEDRYENQKVDLRRRCSQSIGIVPVGNYVVC